MALREEAGLNQYRPYEKLSVGETVAEGWFEGTVSGTFGHDNYLIREANGEVVEVNHCGHLAHKWEKAKILVGDYVKIVYAGQNKLEKGKFKGKPSHQVKLLRDPDLCRRPGQTQAQASQQQQSRGPKFKEEQADDADNNERVKAFADSLADDDGELDI